MASTTFGQTYMLGAPGTGWRKLDIMDKIIDQDPRATPFFEITGMAQASTTKHEWQVRGVPARALNQAVEGDTLEGQAVSAPTRKYNTTQILTTGVEVTRTSMKESHYGVGSIWQDQVDHYTYVHRGDTEYALLRGVGDAGDTALAREMDGLVSAITTNTTDMGGASFTETIFIDGIQTSWDNQDAPMLDALCNSNVKRGIDQFTSLGATRNLDVQTRDVPHIVTKYLSSFGEVDVHLSRDMLNNIDNATPIDATCELALFDRKQMSKAYLDRTHLQPVAKTRDSDTLVIISELTLAYGNEKGAVYMKDLDVTL